jgi:predicted AAA+ superfamily ATPase
MADYLPRWLGPTMRRALSTFPAVLVTGPRQSGKTTLLRAEFSATHRYVSLERPDLRARALADPVTFFAEQSPPLILDEIQYAPELMHYVKDRVDQDRRAGQWLLSGSQSLPLMRGVSQTLAGRIAVLTLDPLSVGEALRRPPLPDLDAFIERVWGDHDGAPTAATPGKDTLDLGAWILRGGFPEVALNPRVDRQLWFASYVQTYLERDVRDLLQVGDLTAFGRFVALAASRTGGLLNMTDFARDVGVSGPTIKRWLSVLEATHLVFLLRPYHRNFGKRIVKSPKLYLLDPGLTCFLLGLHTREAILNGPSAGALAEATVLAECVKAFHQHGEPPAIYGWRSAGGDEVDVIVERGGKLYGMEVKATATPLPGHAESLARWVALAGPRARGVLACRVDRPGALRPGIRAVPWHLTW